MGSNADSVILDPHKTLFLPFGTGAPSSCATPTRSAARIPRTPTTPTCRGGRARRREISPELSRDFRGLRVWLPLKLFGIEPFREQLDEKLDLIEYTLTELRKIEGLEIVAKPQLTILAFRLVRPGLSVTELNELNRDLLELITARKRVMLTPAILDGVFVIRIAISSTPPHRDGWRWRSDIRGNR